MANNQGFASMEDDQLDNMNMTNHNESGNKLQDNPQRASELGKKGADAQPTEAKSRGGMNSRRDSES